MKNFSKAVITLALVMGMTVAGTGLVMADASAVAEQGQSQGIESSGNTGVATGIAEQGQSQGQSQGAFSGVSDSANVTFKDSFNGSKPIRYLPVPTHVSVNTQGGPSHYGGPDYRDNGPHFMSMLSLVSVLNNIDIGQAEIDDEGDIEMVSQIIFALEGSEISANRDALEGKRMFYLNTQKDVTETLPGFKGIAVVTIKADDDNTMNSATLAIKLNQEADRLGATDIILVREGSTKRLKSWGVGLGLSYNYASVTSAQDGAGSAGAGGTGISWGTAEYVSLPYLTAIVGVVNQEENEAAQMSYNAQQVKTNKLAIN